MSKKKFNGQPMSHWHAKADELLIYILAHEAWTVDTRSIIGKLVHERLIHLANAVNPELYKKTMENHEAGQKAIAHILNSMTGNKPKKGK